MRAVSILGGVSITLGLSAVLAGLIFSAQHFTLNAGATTTGGATRVNQYVTIFGATQSILLFTVLAVIGVDDVLNRRPLSPLFAPLVATKAVLLLLLTMLSVTAVDVLLHGVRNLRWMFMFDSDVRLLVSLLYLALPLTLAWQVGVILRGRDASWQILVALLGAATGASGLVILLVSRA